VTGTTAGSLQGTNAGSTDIFLVKYNSSGIKQWTKQLRDIDGVATSGADSGIGMTVDSADNIYVTGYVNVSYDSTITDGLGDILLVKYNSSGTIQWTKQYGTSYYDFGSGVTVDSSNNIYVAGYTEGGLGGDTNSGSSDVFLLKYNSSGTKQWTKQFGTSSPDSGKGLVVDSSDDIYVYGTTAGGLDGNSNLGSGDVFLVKYKSDGTRQ